MAAIQRTKARIMFADCARFFLVFSSSAMHRADNPSTRVDMEFFVLLSFVLLGAAFGPPASFVLLGAAFSPPASFVLLAAAFSLPAGGQR
jgi:hypothetical protein